MTLSTSLISLATDLAHGGSFAGSPVALWSTVGADAVIAAACFAIPLAVLSCWRRRPDPASRLVMWLFGAFIVVCGITHLMDIWAVWQPEPALQALTKIATALISVAAATGLWLLIPHALKMPTAIELQRVRGSLEVEVQRRTSAEERVVDIEQNLAVTLGSIGAGFVAADRQGRVTRMNAVAEKVTGWPEAAAHGMPLWTVFAREGRPAGMELKNPIDVMVEAGTTVDMAHNVTAVARDGTRTAVEVKAALTLGRGGDVRGMAMVFRDLTAQNRAQEAASRLAAIVEGSSDAIISKTLDGRITSWNGAAQSMFGYGADEAIGRPIQMLMPPEYLDEEMRILSDLARGEVVPAFDTVRRRKDGSRFEVSVTISPIRDGAGRIVGASKIARDVSPQRRAEAALRESEGRLRFTLEAARIGDWELDLRTGAVRRSLRHDRCFGYQQLQADWSFDAFTRHVHPDDRGEVRRSFDAAIAGAADWRFECRVVWPDASVHWIDGYGTVVVEDGQARRMQGIVTDITAQKSAEGARATVQRLEAENRQILESNRLKSLFLANMSHELRTPLNAIIGFAELLHAGVVPASSPQHQKFLGHIGTSGRHLLQLINDVLDLSKVESGKLEFFPEPVNLPVLVKDLVEVLQMGMQVKGLEMVVDIEPALDGLELDQARLKQVLFNYLSNAIKFTPQGGRITLRARSQGPAHFRIEVEDTGVGIEAADIDRLFVEFQQLDAGSNKRHQGTGLGLALTRRLVQGQGGDVGVSSVPGRGSVFHLVLPRRAPPAQGQAPAMPAARDGHRLLVIENDLRVETRLSQGLGAAGVEIDVASSGELAIRRAAARIYQAITLELKLSDQDGLAVLASIRSHGLNIHSPVRGLTLATGERRTAAFAITDVLSKPIRSSEVVAALGKSGLLARPQARVLVIDDDPLAIDLMAVTLRSVGLVVAGVLDAREALRDIERHRPDAIVLDLMMPGFDGFAVLEALSRMPLWRTTPVFVWTSMILTDEEYALLSRSALAVLGKGGGAMADLIERLIQWRPQAIASTGVVP